VLNLEAARGLCVVEAAVLVEKWRLDAAIWIGVPDRGAVPLTATPDAGIVICAVALTATPDAGIVVFAVPLTVTPDAGNVVWLLTGLWYREFKLPPGNADVL